MRTKINDDKTIEIMGYRMVCSNRWAIAYLEYLTIGAQTFKYRPSSLAALNRSAIFVFGLTYISNRYSFELSIILHKNIVDYLFLF